MHRIESTDKQQGITQAWHGLTEIKPDLSIDNNWLNDWDIKAQPLFTETEVAPDANVASVMTTKVDTGFSILTATDDPSITIGVPFNPSSYRPITNAEFLQLMRDSTEGIDGMKLVSVGSVRGRGRVFASFQTAELDSYKAGGRTFEPFLNFGNGHDKSSVLWANTSNIATVCDNTFQMNLSSVEEKIVSSVRARHTKNMALKLPELGLLIRQANQAQQNFAVAFEGLAGTYVSPEDAERFFMGFVVDTDRSESTVEKISTRARNIVGRLMELFYKGKGNNGQNLADLFSAATDYYSHENAGNGKNPMRQFQSSEFGAGMVAKQRVFDILKDGEATEAMIAKGAKLLNLDVE